MGDADDSTSTTDRPRAPTGDQPMQSLAPKGSSSNLESGTTTTMRSSPHILSSDKNSSSIPYADTDAGQSGTAMLPVLCDLGFGDQAGKMGTYCSFIILVIGIVSSIVAQAVISGDEDVDPSFTADCPTGYEQSCRSNQAVLRISMALTCVFALDLIMTLIDPSYFDRWWMLKFILFAATCVGFYYADAKVFDHNGYAWFGRVGGFLFIMLQQVILLDFAMSWSERWEANSEAERGFAEQIDRWRLAILGCGVGLIVLSIVGVGLMFHYFKGCASNDTINSLCLVSIVVGTIYQLKIKTSASILTSGVMAAYYTYTAFSALTLGSDLTCNPTISGKPQLATTIIGMVVVTVSLSYTVYNTISILPPNDAPDGDLRASQSYNAPGLRGLLASVLMVFILGSAYYSMVLTNWSTLQEDFQLGNARQGETAMWLQASAQWVCFLMYLWAMTAPMLFPDRFS